MKTVKKLFSLLLVAILLVSAIPFYAAAEEIDPQAEPEKYRVNFMMPAGNWVQILVEPNSKIPTGSIPTATAPEGKEFVGWSFTQGGAAQDITSVAITTHTNVYSVCKDVHVHDHSSVVTAESCTTAGYTTFTCSCGDTYTEAGPAATGHSWGAWEVTTEPTDRAPGVETRSCTACGEVETKEIPKNTTLVSFYSEESNQSWDCDYELYQTITSSDLPSPKKVVGKKFVGWYDVSGNRLQVGDTWSGQHSEYFARYIEGEDGLSTISVYARFYVDGVQQGNTTFLYDQTFEDGTYILNWLQTHESTTFNAIFSVPGKTSADYEWEPRYYYDYSGNEPLSSQDLIANGDKSIVVKVYAKSTARANVLLYVHNKVGSEVAAIYEMPGYTAGNTVTLSEAKTVIKNKTGKNYNVTGLYTDAAWDQLVAGQKPTASNGVKVSDNGTLRLHVVVSNFTAGSISTKPADSTNPATGDTIMMTAGIMAMSAAALVTLMELRKRKMI